MNSNMVIFVGPEIATGKKKLPYGDFEAKSIPPKKCFFWNDKKIENRPGVAEIGRKGSESFWDITTETFDTFP